MKRIGILLLLLAMVFAGCEKIKNQVDIIQGGIKSNVTKILDSKADSENSDTTQLEQVISDTSSMGMYNLPMLKNPYSTEYQYPLYSPLRLDTTGGIGNIHYPYRWNTLTKPLWNMDSLSFSYNSPVIGDLYERSN